MSDKEIIKSYKNKADEISHRGMIWILVDLAGIEDDKERRKMFKYIAKLVGYKPHKAYVSRGVRVNYAYDVEAMQKDILLGMSIGELAKKYAVPKSVISYRKHNLTEGGVNLVDNRRKKTPHVGTSSVESR